MSVHDWLVIWHDVTLVATWIAVSIFIVSGFDDLLYDLVGYYWSLYKFIKFANRERLTLNTLRIREQQQIAVMVPAWQESDVIGKMVENILHRVQYQNYIVFVGTYPNDLATQRAVDELAAAHPQVVKVVASHPGPTNKADNLNQIYRAIRCCERQVGINFDIFVMHDAEDLVHPYSFLVYNYLIPRAEIIQLPILPLPVSHLNWTHWVYADEFTETHIKDVVAREVMGGFVPFAGVGTGFSRRALSLLENKTNEAIFNEGSLTEDYSMSLKVHLNGLRSIFVRLILGDDHSPWYTPLMSRPGFVTNKAFFPRDFNRSIRQKTRWIMGISLQEWERSGWSGSLAILQNLVKDRKIFVSSIAVFCGYLVLIYFIVSALAQRFAFMPQWIPLVSKDSPLYYMLLIATFFMIVRLVQRFVLVSIVYGPIAGLLAVPRMIYGNVISVIAAFRALRQFLEARQGKTKAKWDKTDHLEGIGDTSLHFKRPTRKHDTDSFSFDDCLAALQADDAWGKIHGLEMIPRTLDVDDQQRLMNALQGLAKDENHHIRAMVSRVCGFLRWPETDQMVVNMLYDPEWIVRSNAARALLKFENLPQLLLQVFARRDRYAWDVIIRELEQNDVARGTVLTMIDTPEMAPLRDALEKNSTLFRLETADSSYREKYDEACRLNIARPTPGKSDAEPTPVG